MNADGSDPRRLTRSPGENGTPTWSPDGRTIASSARLRSRVMNADGSNRHRLAAAAHGNPAWSPDGRTIAYTSDAPATTRSTS